MTSMLSVSGSTNKMPPYFLYLVIAVCISPFLLSLLGVNFGSQATGFDLDEAASWPKHQQLDAFFYRLTGAFTHTILEWTAFCAAIFTVALAFSHYIMSKDYTTPVIGTALFLAGCMDAFHTLAAARLIEAVADNRNLIPFTWAICRIFNSLILIGGVSLLLLRKPKSNQANLKFLAVAFVVSAIVAYAIIHYCAVSSTLPQTQFPDSFITRPYDVVPLVLFAFAGVFLFPLFYRRQPSVFAHALVIAMIPEVVVELHMAFGSSALFDHNFNIAHFLKIFAYVVPFCGLLMDYIHTYRAKELEAEVRAKTEVALTLALNNANIANKAKSEFLANMSHELRTPLNPLLILSKSLMNNKSGNLNDSQVEDVKFIFEAGHDLLELIDDLMDLSKAEAGMLSIVSNDLEIQRIGADLKAKFSPLVDQKGLPLLIEIDPNLPTYMIGDHQRTNQIIKNFLSNAFKFTASGHVKLHIFSPPKTTTYNRKSLREVEVIAFTVVDTGIGIPKDKQALIFEAFQQEDSSISRKYGGTGLGLSIAVKLTDLLDGEISLKSLPDVGSSFTLYLPLHGINGSADQKTNLSMPSDVETPTNTPNDKPFFTAKKKADTTSATAVNTTHSTNPTPATNSTAKSLRNHINSKRVLLVDDDMRNVFALSKILSDQNFKVDIASNGKMAIEKSMEAQYDIILMDIAMPIMNGYDAIIAIRALPNYQQTPIVAVTANAMKNDLDQCIDAGANDTITKPIDIDDLIVKINHYLENGSQEQSAH